MNNDPTPLSSAARLPLQRHEGNGDGDDGRDFDDDRDPDRNWDQGRDEDEVRAPAAAEESTSRPAAERDDANAPPGTPPPDPEAVARNEKRRSGLARKMKYLIHLSKSLDSVFMAELCMLYYMECSLPRLLLRFIPHALFLLPRADSFLLNIPAQRAHVFAILVPNAICLLLHLLCTLPHASESSRGYLHGGVIIDFIGQKAPTSKLGFVLLDFLILAIQCVMLTVDQERHLVRTLMARTGTRKRRSRHHRSREESGAGGSSDAIPSIAVQSTQDHDAEERGILRDAPSIMVGSEDIEMQPLFDRSDAAERERAQGDDNCDSLVQNTRRSEAADLTDVLRSGNAILADLHVVHILRTAGSTYQNPAAYSIQRLSYMATLATMSAENRLRAEANRRE